VIHDFVARVSGSTWCPRSKMPSAWWQPSEARPSFSVGNPEGQDVIAVYIAAVKSTLLIFPLALLLYRPAETAARRWGTYSVRMFRPACWPGSAEGRIAVPQGISLEEPQSVGSSGGCKQIPKGKGRSVTALRELATLKNRAANRLLILLKFCLSVAERAFSKFSGREKHGSFVMRERNFSL
jgi:hypothetical protein